MASNCNSELEEDLIISAICGDYRLMEECLSAGADINYSDSDGQTALHFAVLKPHSDIVSQLINEGADLNRASLLGMTPLHYAVKGGSVYTISKLITKGSNSNTADTKGWTPLHHAILSSKEDIVSELLNGGSDPSVRDTDGQTLLHYAARHGSRKIISTLINIGLDPNMPDKHGQTPLHCAAMNASEDTISELLEKGANSNVVNKDGQSPLHCAVIYGIKNTVSELIKGGSDSNMVDKNGKTPLHYAAYAARHGFDDNMDQLFALINRGSDPNMADNCRKTFHYAAYAFRNGFEDNIDILSELIDGGSDPNITDNDGNTASDLAPLFISLTLFQEAKKFSFITKQMRTKVPQNYISKVKLWRELRKELRGLGLEHVSDLQDLLHESFQKCFWNRVYLVGPYSVGKSCLAKILVGETVPISRQSTDGIWIYMGRAGMDVDKLEWVLFPQGNAITEVLTNMLMSISTSETRSSVMEDNMHSDTLNKNLPPTRQTLTTVSVHRKRPHYQTEIKDKSKRNKDKILEAKTALSDSESEINIKSFPLEEQKNREPGSVAHFEHEELHQNEEPVKFDLLKQMPIAKVFPEKMNKPSNTAMQSFETFDDSFVIPVNTAKISHQNPDQQLRSEMSSNNETDARIIFQNHKRRDSTSLVGVLETSIERKHAISSQLAESLENTLYLPVDSELTTDRTSDMSYDKIHQLLVKAVKEGKYKQSIVPIDIWDFGGQKDYYMTHQLFITSRGIFVLVFNGCIDLHKRMSDLNFLPGHFGKPTIAVYLLHWVNSILTYCKRTDNGFPRIVFVATHKDKKWFQWSRKARRKQLEDDLQKLFKFHAGLKHLEFKPLIFVDATNPEDPEIGDLRKILMLRATEHPRWGESMPTKWIPLELQLAQKSAEGFSIISRDQLMTMNSKNKSMTLSERQVETFLKVQHSLGKLLYFDVENLRDFIIISPAYLVEVLRSIVTEKQFWPKGKTFSTILKKLKKTGMIERDEIYYLWGQENFKHILPYKNYMLQILVHLDVLIAPRTSFEDVNSPLQDVSRFMIPCMITKGNNTTFLKRFWKSSNSIVLAYTFIEKVIPPALSYRFLSSFITWWDIKYYKEKNREKRMLFSDLAVLKVDNLHDIAVQVKTKRVIVSLIHADSKDDIIPTLASSLQECLTAAIIRISEFYSMLSEDVTPTHVNSIIPFKIDFGVFCKSDDLCFFNHNEIPLSTDEPIWICKKHKLRHAVKSLTAWFSEKEPCDGCTRFCNGLGKVEREQCPLPHHIRRLAAQLSPDECRQVTIYLGLKMEQWYDLEYQFQHQPSNNLKFMALWSSTIRSRHLCFNDLKNVLENIGLTPHLLCQVFRDVLIDIYDMPEDALNIIPSVNALHDLSNHIGNSTMQLAIELEVDLFYIEQIQHDFKNKLLEQTRKLLQRWRQNRTPKPTYLRLSKSLYRVEIYGPAYTVLRPHVLLESD